MINYRKTSSSNGNRLANWEFSLSKKVNKKKIDITSAILSWAGNWLIANWNRAFYAVY